MMLATLLNAAHPRAMRLLISGRRSPASGTVLPRYTYLSTFSMTFPSMVTVDVMAVSFSITLVLLRFMLRPTGLLAKCMSVSMLSSSSGDLATRTILSSAKIKCDRCSPSMLIHLPSQLIWLIMAPCRHAVKSFGEILSPCLTPLCRLILSLSLRSFRIWRFRNVLFYACFSHFTVGSSKARQITIRGLGLHDTNHDMRPIGWGRRLINVEKQF